MATTEAQARSLRDVATAMGKRAQKRNARDEGIRVFIQHTAMPIPMSTAGPALGTREEALDKAQKHLAGPQCSQAWLVWAGHVEEVGA